MNRAEVSALLSTAAVYDRRTIGDVDIEGWMSFMEHVSFDQAHAAVLAHYRETRDWLTPDDVLHRIQQERNRRITESDFTYVPSDPDEPPALYLARLRAQLAAVADGRPIPAAAQALKARPVRELISGVARTTVIPREVKEVLGKRRHPALGMSCPRCRVPSGQVCLSGTGQPLGVRLHPSRLDAWAVVTVPCPECRSTVAAGCLELGQPYPHGAHQVRLELAEAERAVGP
jgi:hypothetical protein